MDRMPVCGTCDLGSIPSGSTKIMRRTRVVFADYILVAHDRNRKPERCASLSVAKGEHREARSRVSSVSEKTCDRFLPGAPVSETLEVGGSW